MKRVFNIVLFLVIAHSVYSQNLEPMSLYTLKVQENIARQKVKVERMYLFPANPSDYVGEKDSLRNETFYNDLGKEVKSSSYFADMTIINEREYNELGKEIRLINKDGKGNIKETVESIYDSDNNLYQVKYFGPTGELKSVRDAREKTDGEYKLKFNDKGEIISKTYSHFDPLTKIHVSRLLSPSDEIKYENKYVLDENMQISEWYIVNNLNRRNSKTVFSYDANGNRTEELKYDGSGNLTDRIVTVYENNLKSESKHYQSNDKLKQVVRYKYEF